MENKTTKAKVKGGLPAYASKLPSHLTNLVRIIKNNAEIRRFTAIGIINYLTQKEILNGTNKYVEFLWDKVIVYCDGWSRSYKYKEVFIINALVASFTSFANSAEMTINEFAAKENLFKDNTSSPVEGEQAENSSEVNSEETVEETTEETNASEDEKE